MPAPALVPTWKYVGIYTCDWCSWGTRVWEATLNGKRATPRAILCSRCMGKYEELRPWENSKLPASG